MKADPSRVSRSLMRSHLGWVVYAATFAMGVSSAFAGPDRGFQYVVNSSEKAYARSQVVIPKEMEDAANEAEDRLQLNTRNDNGAIVFRIRSPDGELLSANAELHIAEEGVSGYVEGRVTADHPGVITWNGERRYELRVRSRGFELWTRKAFLKSGHILIWDDIIVTPLSPRRAAVISGTVWLEGDASPAGIPISVENERQAESDDHGVFVATGICPGSVWLSGWKRGYIGLGKRVDVKPGETSVGDLEGYVERYAVVRWVYQPTESRSFVSGIVSGKGTISVRGLNRISFAEGFQVQKSGQPDFAVDQKEKKLFIHNTDQRDRGGPGFVEVKGVAFEELREVPEAEYRGNNRELCPGAVFVLRCADLKHFAKIEVLSIAAASGVYEPD